jgi:hypothetical protein
MPARKFPFCLRIKIYTFWGIVGANGVCDFWNTIFSIRIIAAIAQHSIGVKSSSFSSCT